MNNRDNMGTKEEWAASIESGCTNAEISAFYGVPHSSVQYYIRKWGLQRQRVITPKPAEVEQRILAQEIADINRRRALIREIKESICSLAVQGNKLETLQKAKEF